MLPDCSLKDSAKQYCDTQTSHHPYSFILQQMTHNHIIFIFSILDKAQTILKTKRQLHPTRPLFLLRRLDLL